jgi:hypothetical protein
MGSNLAMEWLATLLLILEISVWTTIILTEGFHGFLSASRQMMEYYLTIGHDFYLPYPL